MASKLERRIERRKADSEEYRKGAERAAAEISQANQFMEAIAEQLEARGVSKAELARRVDRHPSAVRKLFMEGANPTIETAIAVATALGLRLTLTPAESPRPQAHA